MRKFLFLAGLAAASAVAVVPAAAQPAPTTAIAPLGPNSALLSLTAEGRAGARPISPSSPPASSPRAGPRPRRCPRTAGGWTR